MSYRIYHTEGFILASKDIKEHNRLFWILTPDLGLVTVMAQGVRKITSKLRPHLQDLAHVELALVRGREFWRLIGVERTNVLSALMAHPPALAAWARVSALLRRLIRGEGEQQVLFGDIKEAAQVLNGLTQEREIMELVLMLELRLLRQLGYVPQRAELVSLVSFTNWHQRPRGLTPSVQRVAQQEIVAALAASQL